MKRRALNLVIDLGTDDAVLKALSVVPDYLKVYGIKRLRSKKPRPEVTDGFLLILKSSEGRDRLFQGLLPYGSTTLVEKHLPQLLDGFSTMNWTRLAKYHPEVVLETIHDWSNRSSDEDPRLMVIANQMILRWASSEATADLALDIIRTMVKTISLKRLPLDEIIKRRPVEVVDVILGVEERIGVPSGLYWPTDKLPVDRLLALFDRYTDVVEEWAFNNLNLEQRGAVYKIVRKGWRRYDGILSTTLVASLPEDLRVKEARRHVKLKVFEPKPRGRIPYIAFLPWDEAMELQRPFLRSSDADTRAEALKCQIEAAKYHEAHLGDALKLALKCQHEQSTVRDKVISALWEIPGIRWKEEHLDGLGTVIRHAMTANDLAKAGPYDLLRLVTGLLSFHPRWAAKQVAVIMKEHKGFIPRPSNFKFTGAIPTKEVVEILAEEMTSWLEKFLENPGVDQDSLTGLGNALGKCN